MLIHEIYAAPGQFDEMSANLITVFLIREYYFLGKLAIMRAKSQLLLAHTHAADVIHCHIHLLQAH